MLLLLASLLPAAAQQLVISNAGGSVIIQGQGTIQFGPGGALDPQIAAAMQFSGAAQAAVVQAEFDPPEIALGETATYRVVITAMPEASGLPPQLPAPAGLVFEFTGRGFAYGSGVGAIQPRTTFNYRVTATAPGSFLMPAFNASANAQPVPVPSAALRVLPKGAAVAGRTGQLSVELPPGEFYIGQTIPVRLRFRDTPEGRVVGLSQAQVRGDAFIVDQNYTRYRRDARIENGRVLGDVFADLSVTALKEGRLPLEAQAMIASLQPREGTGITLPGYQPLVDAEPALITVRRLPTEGRRTGFTGGIGAFTLDPPALSATSVKAGEPVTLGVVVRGFGNTLRLVPPKLPWAKGWQVFQPAPGASAPALDGNPGFASFSYTMIPLNRSVRETPAIPFSYFDPAGRGYVDLTIPPVPITVTGGADVPVVEAAPPPKDEGEETEPELKFAELMKSPSAGASRMQPVQARPRFLLAQLLPAFALGGLWWWDRRRRFLADHPEVVARTKARRAMRRELRHLRRAAAAADDRRFLDAAARGLQAAAAPATRANPDALVAADVLAALPERVRVNTTPGLVQRVFAAKDAAQFTVRGIAGEPVLAWRGEVESLLQRWRETL